MTEKEKQLDDKAKAWFGSKEGAESLKKSLTKAMENSKRFKMCRQIRPEVLRRPFTI